MNFSSMIFNSCLGFSSFSYFLNKSRRAVIRRWLTKEEIMEEFGDDLTDEAIAKLNEYFNKIQI